MPSAQPLPTVTQLVKAARDALVGERDRYGDPRSGAFYDHASGPMAVLLAREADRDRDAFRAIYWDDAEGDDLTTLIQGRTISADNPNGIQRILDTFGQGVCQFARPSAAGGGGSFLQGTRVQVAGNPPVEYQVAVDTQVAAGALVANIPMAAVVIGSGSAVATTTGLSLEDAVYDLTWAPVALTCADGTDYEDAQSYRGRARTTLLNQRNGYQVRLEQFARQAGAAYVAFFASSYGLAAGDFDDDHGINAIYVADKNYTANAALINAATVALDSVRVLGADLWLGGITRTPLQVRAILNLVDNPGQLDLVPIKRAAVQALLAYFAPTNAGYVYKRAGLQGVLSHAHGSILAAAIPYQWAASTAYGVGDTVFPSPATGYIYQCTAAGVSGPVQPPFSTVVGATTTDNGVAWLVTSYDSTAGIYVNGVRQAADPAISASAFPAVLSRYVLAARDIALSVAGPV